MQYQRGTPPSVGMYACRLRSAIHAGMLQDYFLFWDGERWYGVAEDRVMKGFDVQWIGPLPRTQDAR